MHVSGDEPHLWQEPKTISGLNICFFIKYLIEIIPHLMTLLRFTIGIYFIF